MGVVGAMMCLVGVAVCVVVVVVCVVDAAVCVVGAAVCVVGVVMCVVGAVMCLVGVVVTIAVNRHQPVLTSSPSDTHVDTARCGCRYWTVRIINHGHHGGVQVWCSGLRGRCGVVRGWCGGVRGWCGGVRGRCGFVIGSQPERTQQQLCRSCDFIAQGCGRSTLPWVAAPLMWQRCKCCD